MYKLIKFLNFIYHSIKLFSFLANFLEIDVCKPFTHTDDNGKRYTDYEIHMRTNLPVFAIKEFVVRRRYSDFVWLRKEIERTVKIYIPGIRIKCISGYVFHPDFIYIKICSKPS